MLSFGGGTPVAPTFSGNEVRTQVTAGTDFHFLLKIMKKAHFFRPALRAGLQGHNRGREATQLSLAKAVCLSPFGLNFG